MTRRVTAVLFIIVFTFAIPAMAAPDYHIRSGYSSPPPPQAVPAAPQEVPVWELPLGILLAVIGTLPVESLVAVKTWAMLGYRRISAKNVLDHPGRSAIFSAIQKNPGIHLHGLARETKTTIGTLRHHLHMLIDTEKVSERHNAADVSFYENDGTYTPVQQVVLRHLRNETRKKILCILLDNPSSGRDEIARETAMNGATITWHMNRLEKDGIIQAQRIGRRTCYRMPDDVRWCLYKHLPA